MKSLIKDMPKSHVITIAVLLVLIAIALAAANTLGRYVTSFGEDVDFSISSRESVTVYAKDQWIDGASTVIISNTTVTTTDGQQTVGVVQKDVSARVRLYIPIDNGIPTVTMVVGTTEYIGYAVPLKEGTEAYAEHGRGYIYQFLDKSGKEVTFDFKGGESKDYTMIIKLKDVAIPTENYKTIIETVRSNGGDVK